MLGGFQRPLVRDCSGKRVGIVSQGPHSEGHGRLRALCLHPKGLGQLLSALGLFRLIIAFALFGPVGYDPGRHKLLHLAEHKRMQDTFVL